MEKFYRHIRPEQVDNNVKNRSVTGVFVEKQGILNIGTSTCSNNDHFNKKLGRVISEGRAIKNPEVTVEAKDYPSALSQFHNYCNSLGGKQVKLKSDVHKNQ